MTTEKQVANYLINRYQTRDMTNRLDKQQFQNLFREAVKDYYPKLKNQYADQTIYGISFEIGGIIQRVYADNFATYIYLNTEEQYQENIKDCEEDEKSFYRFEAWSEWDVVSAESELFENLQDYLTQNSLYPCLICTDYLNPQDDLEDNVAIWYEENESALDEAFEEESGQVRMWMAEVLGELRMEGFWEEQGNPGLYVIPFGGECEIETEELIETYQLMDAGYHGTEYIDFLKSCDL